MGRVWLCDDQLAKQPLEVSAGISLYSFEELCYYLYHNVESVEESFFNEYLCQWMAKELGKQELSEQILEGLAQEMSGCWCMEQILQAGGYYNIEEMNQVLRTAETMKSKTPAQRAKLRGDRFLRSGRYKKALLEYLAALEEDGDLFFQGQVWHNLGTLYAKQFLFTQAAECYKHAYETGQQVESSEAYLLALACQEGKAPKPQNPKMAGLLEDLREMKQSGNRSSYENAIEDLLLQLRAEYRKSE